MRKSYKFPVNIIQSGKWFNGTIEVRNVVEGTILALIGVAICRSLNVDSDRRTQLYVLLCVPLGALGLFGIQGEYFSSFLVGFYKWLKNRKPYIYNPHGIAYDKRTSDLIFEEPHFQNTLANWMDKIKGKMFKEIDYVEGENFRFALDPEWDYLKDKTHDPESEDENIQHDSDQSDSTKEPELDLSDLMTAEFGKEE